MNATRTLATLSLCALGSMCTTAALAAGSFCYVYEDGCYETPQEACGAVAQKRREDKSVDNPYGQVAGAKDEGDGFWCKLVDKNGNDTEQHYGSKRSRPTRAGSKAPPATAAAAKASEPSDCELDDLEGQPLRDRVVSLMQRYTDEQNTRLIDDPAGAANASKGLNIGKGFFTGDYGTLLEDLVARRVGQDKCLSRYVRHLSRQAQAARGKGGAKGSHPDFRGTGRGLTTLEIDITTEGSQATKRATDGAKSDYVYILYRRGLCVDATTGMAVKIPAGREAPNGKCPTD